MLDDRDYMRQPPEARTPGTVLRSAWGAFVERLRRLRRWFWPQSPLPSPSPVQSRKVEEEFSTEEFVENEVNPILEKISAKGIQSLTARERQILQKAREKMPRP